MKRIIVTAMVMVMVMVSTGNCGDNIRTPENAIKLIQTYFIYFNTADSRLETIVCADNFFPLKMQSQTVFNNIAEVLVDPYHGVDAVMAVESAKNMRFSFSGMSAQIVDDTMINISGTFDAQILEPESGVWMPLYMDQDISGRYPMVIQNGKLILCK